MKSWRLNKQGKTPSCFKLTLHDQLFLPFGSKENLRIRSGRRRRSVGHIDCRRDTSVHRELRKQMIESAKRANVCQPFCVFCWDTHGSDTTCLATLEHSGRCSNQHTRLHLDTSADSWLRDRSKRAGEWQLSTVEGKLQQRTIICR